MTKQITLTEALRLVDFGQFSDGSWYVETVKGDCNTVEGNCVTVERDCRTVKGSCSTVKGYCGTVERDCCIVKGFCGTVKGDCGIVEGRVRETINGRQWQYVETPREQMVRLIEEGASKEELLKALEELNG